MTTPSATYSLTHKPTVSIVKALVDWDDMYIMPFVKDIQSFSVLGLAPDADYYREGKFPLFLPSEYGAIVGAVGADGKLTPIDVEERRDERILNTSMFREQYVKALEIRDPRVAQSDMWMMRRVALKAYHLLMEGGEM